MRTVCLCSESNSGAGTHFLPSLQRRGAFAQVSKGRMPFVGARAKPLKRHSKNICGTKNNYTKSEFY